MSNLFDPDTAPTVPVILSPALRHAIDIVHRMDESPCYQRVPSAGIGTGDD